MKKNLLNSPQKSNGKVLDALFAEMILDKAIAEFRKSTAKRRNRPHAIDEK